MRWLKDAADGALTMLLSSAFHSSVVLLKKDSLNCGVMQSLMSKHLSLFLIRLSTMFDVIKSCFVVVLIFLRCLDLSLVRKFSEGSAGTSPSTIVGEQTMVYLHPPQDLTWLVP